jgi:hypothetical protein
MPDNPTDVKSGEWWTRLNQLTEKLGGIVGEKHLDVIEKAGEELHRLRARESVAINCIKAMEQYFLGNIPFEVFDGIVRRAADDMMDSVNWLVTRDEAMAMALDIRYQNRIEYLEKKIKLLTGVMPSGKVQ